MKTIDLSKEVADILSKEIQAEMDKHIIDTLTNLFGTIKECSRPCKFIDHPIYNKRLGLIKNEYMGSYEILVKKHKQSVRTQVNK